MDFEKAHPMTNQGKDTALTIARESLGKTIAALEVYCKSPPVAVERYLLWFTPNEVDAVNRVWTEQGFTEVVRRWGTDRRYSTGATPANVIPDEHQLRFLTVLRMEDDKEQSNYYRSAPFQLQERQATTLLEILKSTGVLSKMIPERDTVLDLLLQSKEQVGVWCFLQWYGPENFYGRGVVFEIGVELDVKVQGRYYARLQITEEGSALAFLFAAQLYETGYEGHDHRTVTLNARQLDALREFIANQGIPNTYPGQLVTGIWMGNSVVR
jgi:hypothetical protein